MISWGFDDVLLENKKIGKKRCRLTNKTIKTIQDAENASLLDVSIDFQ